MLKKRTVDAHQTRLPPPSRGRLTASLSEAPLDLNEFVEQAQCKDETVLYLAYGSNLANATFRGKRGIKPLAQINVQVPSLQLTFDLPGIPYLEPCFANSGLRDDNDHTSQLEPESSDDEKSSLLPRRAKTRGYRKDDWHKGLIGVVYEVTAKDYAHIIATEGGGASYQDILVNCHPFANEDPSEPVPRMPTQPPFKAHTLFAPALPPDQPPPDDGGRLARPNRSYAQASARYLKLITDGAAELGLPYEYQDHLHSLRPFKITTIRQHIGKVALVAMWVPVVFFAFGLGKIFTDKRGRMPAWLRQFTGSVFAAVWMSYDKFFKPMFGDGERSLTDGEDVAGYEQDSFRAKRGNWHVVDGEIAESELEKSGFPAHLV